MRWKTTLCFLLTLFVSREILPQCNPAGSPSCVANITNVQQLTDCIAAGGTPNISVDLPDITCDYDISGRTINLENQVDIRFTGEVTVNSATDFTASTGNATITINGIVVTANNGGGNGDMTFDELNAALAALTGTATLESVVAALPVEFSSFSGKANSRNVRLDWSTATESNNKHFEIEFSTDGKAFKQIGIVAGGGTTYVTQNYQFEHQKPAKGVNYYRLRQVDFDGAFEYSAMVTVDMGNNKVGKYRLFPNPVRTSFTIQIPEGELPANVSLINTLGQEIRLSNGSSDIFELPNSLQSGTYIVRFESGGETRFERIVVQ